MEPIPPKNTIHITNPTSSSIVMDLSFAFGLAATVLITWSVCSKGRVSFDTYTIYVVYSRLATDHIV